MIVHASVFSSIMQQNNKKEQKKNIFKFGLYHLLHLLVSHFLALQFSHLSSFVYEEELS